MAGAFLMVSDVDRDGPDSSDYDAVIAFLEEVEARYDSVAAGDLTGRVVGVTPGELYYCLLYTSPSPRDKRQSRMPSSA